LDQLQKKEEPIMNVRKQRVRWASKQQYNQIPSHCPACNSPHVIGLELDFGTGQITQRKTCNDCRAKWIDYYKLIKYLKER
jgi:transposase-like protein